MVWSILEIASGLAIAAAGLYVVANSLHGRYLEYLARLPSEADSAATLIARAKTKYLLASLSRLPVLIVLVLGIALQIVVGARKLYLEVVTLNLGIP